MQSAPTIPNLALRAAVLLAMLALAGRVPASRADEVYKSVDAEGHVVYSDRGTTSTAKKSVVNVVQPDPVEAARAAKEQQILKAEDQQRKLQQVTADNQKAQADHQKQIRCDNARTRYNSLKDANLLYRLDKDGNRVFYTDEQADARKESLRQAMVTACEK